MFDIRHSGETSRRQGGDRFKYRVPQIKPVGHQWPYHQGRSRQKCDSYDDEGFIHPQIGLLWKTSAKQSNRDGQEKHQARASRKSMVSKGERKTGGNGDHHRNSEEEFAEIPCDDGYSDSVGKGLEPGHGTSLPSR